MRGRADAPSSDLKAQRAKRALQLRMAIKNFDDAGRDRARVAQVLRHALALLRSGWTQVAAARNAEMRAVHGADESAVCWHPGGAIVRACVILQCDWMEGAIARLIVETLIDANLVAWADTFGRTFDDIETIWLRAIYNADALVTAERAA